MDRVTGLVGALGGALIFLGLNLTRPRPNPARAAACTVLSAMGFVFAAILLAGWL